jgi:competence protein ComEA
MNYLIKEFLTFSNREKKGVLVLLFLMMLVAGLPYFMDDFGVDAPTDFTAFEEEIEKLTKIDLYAKRKDTQKGNKSLPTIAEVSLCKFNPNNLSVHGWMNLGLQEWQAKSIKNYEKKGGHFRSKEDLKKMYCLKANEYSRLEPFIVIPKNTNDSSGKNKNNLQKYKHPALEINRADSASFTSLKGIGPVFASRIVKYRNRLGGFLKIAQLMEVYGFDSSLYALVLPNLILDFPAVKKININKADVAELKKHPYFSYKLANLIVNYRHVHGPYKDITEIRNIVLVTDELYAKLVCYITIE